MTKEEAEKAVATFEFPPFHAAAGEFQIYVNDEMIDSTPTLLIYDADGKYVTHFPTTQLWLAYYAKWQQAQSE